MSASPLREVGDKYGRGSTSPSRFSNSSHGLFADFAAMNEVDNNYCVHKKKLKNYYYYYIIVFYFVLITFIIMCCVECGY